LVILIILLITEIYLFTCCLNNLVANYINNIIEAKTKTK
jgi:hypothetical protein